jgi:hypothetical protein
MEYVITTFEHLAFRMEGMIDAFFPYCFINGLKDEIQAQVLMALPQTWLEATKRAKEAHQVVFFQNPKPSFLPRPRPTNPIPLPLL